MMIPTVGAIVDYVLNDQDVIKIDQMRREGKDINSYSVSDAIPMIITRVWGPNSDSAVNGTGFLDGKDATLWLTSRMQGDEPGQWRKPSGF